MTAHNPSIFETVRGHRPRLQFSCRIVRMRHIFRFALGSVAILAVWWIASASQQRPPRPPPPTLTAGNGLVRRLDFTRFKANIQKLAGFGTRYYDTQGNVDAR